MKPHHAELSEVHTPAHATLPDEWMQWNLAGIEALDFQLPPELEAGEPPEARGLRRDQVRLMVSCLSDHRILHTRFDQIADLLDPGDALVINTSGTMNAALNASRADGTPVELHLSTRLPGDLWTVEVRLPTSEGSEPFIESMEGETLHLPGEGRAHLLAPYRTDRRDAKGGDTPIRLWIATLSLPASLEQYLSAHGFPIRYKYVRQEWPLEYYQTVYATERGSAEMPSAGRAFTPEIITRMVAQGVLILPLLLHTGVASLEEGEAPYEEYYRVPAGTARAINQTRLSGGRVIAVGTTTMRALETVTGQDGVTHAGEGWTDLVITPECPVRSADGLLTGLHEPRSSHLAMLSALAGVEPLREAYAQALEKKYRWHEFGDLHLILP